MKKKCVENRSKFEVVESSVICAGIHEIAHPKQAERGFFSKYKLPVLTLLRFALHLIVLLTPPPHRQTPLPKYLRFQKALAR